MEPEAMSNPDMKAQIKAENRNFEITTKRLGKTVELVQDFQELYKALSDSVVLPSDPEAMSVAYLSLHLLMKARSNHFIGSITLLRGYLRNSLLLLRGAIEACAFGAHIRRNPELVDVWLNAGDSDAAYQVYRQEFRRLFPKDDELMSDLYERFDFCSQSIHNSIFSLAGHLDYPGPEEFNFKLFDLPMESLVQAFYYIHDTHKRILRQFSKVLSDEIKGNAVSWGDRFNSVEEKLDAHRENWKAILPVPKTAGS